MKLIWSAGSEAGYQGEGSELARHSAKPGTGSLPVVQAAAGASCLSASAVLFTLAAVGPLTATFYRCALPLPVLAVLAMSERHREGPRPLASHGYAVLAGVFFAINLVCWIRSIADIGAGAATVLGNLQVVFIAGLAWLVMRERPGRVLVAVLPVVLIGVVLVSGVIGSHGTARHPVAGALFGLGTSATYGCFLLILRQTAGQARHPAGQLFDATAAAAVCALIFGLMFGGLHLAIGWRSLGWLVVLTVTAGTTGWLLIARSLPCLPATVSALILLLEPAGAIILGVLALGQWPSLLQLGGVLLVCGGVLLVAGRQARAEYPATGLAAARLGRGRGRPTGRTGSGRHRVGDFRDISCLAKT